MSNRRRWGRYATWPATAAAAALTACGGDAPQSVFEPRSEYARVPDDLWDFVFVIAIVIFVLVMALLVIAIVKFRSRPGDDSLPVQLHGNTRLEVMWTLIPALLLTVVAARTVPAIFDLAAEPEDALAVEVIGHRWWWEFRYPGQDVVTANELHIPAGRPIRLTLLSEEAGGAANAVIHSFWIPALGGKQDAVPGRTNTLTIAADEPGRYQGQCAEYCGLSHANMRALVFAHPPDEFRAWLRDQQQEAAAPEDGSLAARGREAFLGGSCVGCHAIRGTDASSTVGPDLTHFASRETFAGAIFERTDENVARWLDDPPAMKPMHPNDLVAPVGMPDYGLPPDEIEALVAYLQSLR